jgi:hypothetical protein
VIYRHPLAYLLGLEGLALLRAYAGEYDRAFVAARPAEVGRLLEAEPLIGDGVTAGPVDTVAGYRVWSRTYDEPNGTFEYEEPIIREILDTLPAGAALDAACGTGRAYRSRSSGTSS